ncbi:MAG TPA: RNA-guided pseudouridylation complex pseudouridine synthase subunit Cbf5, partial [Candidatus Methanofastidiosa archaeon]|nr:RNA-guided pseudouridylation complex pseudouridine synthase subunit Cbf5 [Candidatus Methanofastidiosa archaeon]
AYSENGDSTALREIIYPIERAVEHLPKIYLKDSAIDAVCHGANVAIPGVAKMEGRIRRKSKVALMSLKGELVAIGTSMADTKAYEKNASGFVVDTHRVVMSEGTYPKHWKSAR